MNALVQRRLLRGTLLTLALFWLGMLVGVSFLATPVKFLAPSLSLPVALDVGRQTFMAFNRVELLLGILLLAPAALLSLTRPVRPLPLGLALLTMLVVVTQSLWLLPVLDARVEIILQGGTPPASGLHRLYIVADVLKLALLGVIAWLASRPPPALRAPVVA